MRLMAIERELIFFIHSHDFHADINECVSNPCLNGGTCVDQVNRYVCNCHDGYGGVNCQTSKYSFHYQMYAQLGTVYIELSAFERFLLHMLSFQFHSDINECSSNPCLNGATCIDQVNGYSCNCQPGYQGVRCQTSKLSFQIL